MGDFASLREAFKATGPAAHAGVLASALTALDRVGTSKCTGSSPVFILSQVLTKDYAADEPLSFQYLGCLCSTIQESGQHGQVSRHQL